MSTLVKEINDEIDFDNVYCIKSYKKDYSYVSRQGNTVLYYKSYHSDYHHDLRIKNLIIDTYSDSIIEDEI